jgi:immune inhibitor A
MLLSLLLITAMLVAPLSAFASGATAPAGPQQLKGRALLDQLNPRQFPNEMPPRDEAVIAAAAGVPVGASAAEAQAITDAWIKQFDARNEKSGPNPIALQERLADIAAAEARGLSPRAAGLGEIGVAKMLMIPFEFDGSNTLDRCDADGNLIDQVTVEGPLHDQIPDPAGTGDNFSIWTDDFSTDWYQNLMFEDGVGVVRTDLNGGAGIDLTGVSATNFYEEQSEGLYSIDGDIYESWIQLPNSTAYYGWDADEFDGTGYPCNGTPSGFGFEFAIDTVMGLNAVDPDFDWAQYDTDGDQVVDHLMLIHAGVDGSAGGGAQGVYSLWAHSWDMYCDQDGDGDLELGCLVQGEDTPADPSDDIYAANYTHIPEDADIGVVVHEYGHDIGLPDYYSYEAGVNNSTAHWIVMSGGSWNGELGGSHPAPFNPWGRWFFGWADPMHVNYDDAAQEVMIGQSDPTPDGTQDSVWVHLPDQSVEVPNMTGDGKGLHALVGDNAFRTLTREFDFTGASAPMLTFDTYFEIEEDWDYAYVQASTDGGTTWTSLLNVEGVYATSNVNGSPAWMGEGGLTGSYDGVLTYDLTAYAGGMVMLRFVYASDTAVQEAGIWIDNISIDDGGANLYFNDLEDSSDWDNDGWEEVPYSDTYPHYYMLEWRNGEGSIANYGQTQLYYFVSAVAVDKFSANVPGMLVWYRNNRYSDNSSILANEFDPPAAGAKGELLLVDSHYDAIEWSGGIWDPDAGAPAPQFSTRRSAMDGAFTLNDGPPWMIHDYADINNPVMDFGSAPAKPAFHDSERSVPGWYFPGDGFVYRVDHDASVVIPAQDIYTTRIRGLEADGAHLDRDGDLTDFWGFTVGGLPLGSGNPGDDNVQYGFHAQVMEQAADGTYGVVRLWNAVGAIQGTVNQSGSTTPVVMGSYVDVMVNSTNMGAGLVDGLYLVPIDPDAEYVPGSAYGGAYPLSGAYAAQLAVERGLTELAALAAEAGPDDVVAVAWSGEVPTGFTVDFGFTVRVTNAPAELQHSAAVFDGATFVGELTSDVITVEDNSMYPVERSRRFNVDRDSFIDGSRPGTYFGGDQTLWAGFFGQMRPVVHTPLNGIPTDAAVDQAWLYLYVTEGRGFTNWSDSVIEVAAHAATTEWMPFPVNWWMPWTMPGGDFGPSGVPNHIGSGKINTWLRLDVTAAVEDMLRSGYNQGFLITNDDDRGVRYGLASKEYWDASKAGYIRVHFRTAD